MALVPHRLLGRQKNPGRKAVELTDRGIRTCAEADQPLWSLIKLIIGAAWHRWKMILTITQGRVECFKEQFSLDSGLEGTDAPHLPQAASQGPPRSLPGPRDLVQLRLGAPSIPPPCCNRLGLSDARIRDPF